RISVPHFTRPGFLMRRLLLVAISVVALHAAIVDRIAITVASQVITELQVDEELRVTAFLNRQPLSRNLQTRRAAADRLVAQLLVEREMTLSRYPLPNADEIDKYVAQVRAQFGSDSEFQQALETYQLSRQTLHDHLALQLMTLRFVEFRFRPETGISESEIESYYQREIANWQTTHPGTRPPSLDASKESIRRTLLEAWTDQILDTWLEESRKQVNIVYLDKSLE